MDNHEPTPRAPYLPRIVGNALICSDGTPHQLLLLEKLYLRCGILSIQTLDAKYRADAPQQE